MANVKNEANGIPVFGTLACVSREGEILHFEGLQASVDAGLLPTTDQLPYLATGSDAFIYDTAAVYKYERTTNGWYKIGARPNSGGGE